MEEQRPFSEKEPVQWINGILSLIGLLVSLGVIVVTPEQMDAIKESLPYIIAFSGALFSLVVFLVNRFITRNKVTPVAFPHDNDGNPMKSAK